MEKFLWILGYVNLSWANQFLNKGLLFKQATVYNSSGNN